MEDMMRGSTAQGGRRQARKFLRALPMDVSEERLGTVTSSAAARGSGLGLPLVMWSGGARILIRVPFPHSRNGCCCSSLLGNLHRCKVTSSSSAVHTQYMVITVNEPKAAKVWDFSWKRRNLRRDTMAAHGGLERPSLRETDDRPSSRNRPVLRCITSWWHGCPSE